MNRGPLIDCRNDTFIGESKVRCLFFLDQKFLAGARASNPEWRNFQETVWLDPLALDIKLNCRDILAALLNMFWNDILYLKGYAEVKFYEVYQI